MSEESGISDQVLSLPSGGGAVTGTGGSFLTNEQTGAGSTSVAIELPPGRGNVQPSLALSYSTGNGLGTCGLGWTVGADAIHRKTSDGVPVYDDEQDTFTFSGEELVPVARRSDEESTVTRYRPRADSGFQRVEHHQSDTTDHWLVRTGSGVVRRYGTVERRGDDPAVVADPDDAARVYSWLLSEQRDQYGNRVVYEYDHDAGDTDDHHWDLPYLSRVSYVDYETDDGEETFLVTANLSYEPRPDPHSRYDPGFEIRTRRRLTRIAVETHADIDRVVRSYELTYRDETPDSSLPPNGVSLLERVRIVGHDDDGNTEELPPVEFEYASFEPDRRSFETVDGLLPRRSIADPTLDFADLFGDGLPDIVEIDDGIRYWRNLGDGRFDESRSMSRAPGNLRLSSDAVRFVDADGDGRIDLATTRPLSGFYPLQPDGGWDEDAFERYDVAPSVDFASRNVAFVDLDGDGATDVLRAGSQYECYFQDADEGWTRTRRVPTGDLDPTEVQLADPHTRFGDATGDGLQDLLVVHDGAVTYWPNTGHGSWGRRVRMRNPPALPADYDPGRLLVGDVDGDGLSDLVYVADDEVTLWLNQAGNAWSEPTTVTGTPNVTDTDAVRLVDLHGRGVPGVLWSAVDETYFLDFVGGAKPYLLDGVRNNLGATTRIEYEPSTAQYLRDRAVGRDWKTTLPQPTWVVSTVETRDEISGGKLTSEFAYHHGYWDGAERDFRGFGLVERRDTEPFDRYNDAGLYDDDSFATVDRRQFSNPSLTRTWFHLGPVGPESGDWREVEYTDEYWSGDDSQLSRPTGTHRLLDDLPRRDARDAVRALAGSTLRREVYALDGSDRVDRPYTVAEFQYAIRDETPDGAPGDRHTFFPHPVTERETAWERGTDPQTTFAVVGDYDDYGQARLSASIACPRGWTVGASTAEYLATYSQTEFARVDRPDRYVVDRVVEKRSYDVLPDEALTVPELVDAILDGDVPRQLTGLTRTYYDGPAFEGLPLGDLGEFGASVRSESLVLTDDLVERAYPTGSAQPDVDGVPPYLDPDAPWSSEYPLSFRESLPTDAGYTVTDVSAVTGDSGATTGYFATTRQVAFDFQTNDFSTERGLMARSRDAFDREQRIVAYDPYWYVPVATETPGGLRTEAEYDYAAMAYWRTTTPNGTQSQVRFTPLGLVDARMNLGQPGTREGDTPEQPGVEYEYDLHAFCESDGDDVTPPYVHTITRKRHRWDVVSDAETARGRDLSEAEIRALFESERTDHPERFVESRTYSDGLGREIQTRTAAEATVFEAPTGGNALPADQSREPGSVVGRAWQGSEPRVRVSGWETYNNKGNVVESFEPFFDEGWAFTSRAETWRQSPEVFDRKVETHYDALDRPVVTVHPDGSENRVVTGVLSDSDDPSTFEPSPWEGSVYDRVDNAGRTHPGEAASYAHRVNTPMSTVFDLATRTQIQIVRNRTPGDDECETYRTTTSYDPVTRRTVVTDALDREVYAAVHDLLGRPIRVESADAGTTWTAYDASGTKIEHRDAKGALALGATDSVGRRVRGWAREAPTDPITLREHLVYGDATDEFDQSTAKARNLLGRIVRQYDEGGLVRFDRYDFKGSPIGKTQRPLSDDAVVGGAVDWEPSSGETLADIERALLSDRSYETSFEYDAMGRVLSRRYPDDVDGRSRELQLSYTPEGALAGVDMVVDADGSDEYRETYVAAIGYDARERRVVAAYGNDVLRRWAYDDVTGRMVRSRTETYERAPTAGGETDRFRPTGTVYRDVGYVHDVGGKVREIRHEAPGSGVVDTPHSTGDGAALVHGRDALVREFTYDAVGRLTRATGRECTSVSSPRPWGDEQACGFDVAPGGQPSVTRANAPDQTATYTETYEYDPAGNMTSLHHTRHEASGPKSWTRRFGMSGSAPSDWTPSPGSVPGTSNRVSHVTDGSAATSRTHEYDEVGNLLRERNSHYTWDWNDRLRSYEERSGGQTSVAARYAYSSGGGRVKKVVDKGSHRREVTEYVDGIFEYRRLELDRTSSGGTVRENNAIHVTAGGNRVAIERVGQPFDADVSFADADRPAIRYQFGDHAGSSSLVVDGDGGWVNLEEYTPFGETTLGGYRRKRYRFIGKERDEESGLYFHGARYYAPWLARWTAADPAGPVDGLNLYSYVKNDPVNLSDPTGMQSQNDDKCTNQGTRQLHTPQGKPLPLVVPTGPGCETAKSKSSKDSGGGSSGQTKPSSQPKQQSGASNQKSKAEQAQEFLDIAQQGVDDMLDQEGPSLDTGGGGGSGSSSDGNATSSESESTGEDASKAAANAVAGAKEAAKVIGAPKDINGRPFKGTTNLWTGGWDAQSKAIVRANTGVQGSTIHNHAYYQKWESWNDQMAEVYGGKPTPPGEGWYDTRNLNVWRSASAKLGFETGLSGKGFRAHFKEGATFDDVAGEIMVEEELPNYLKGALVSGTLDIGGGAFSMVSAAGINNDFVSTVGMAGGAAEMAGGALRIAGGYAATNASTIQGIQRAGTATVVGSGLVRFGGGVGMTVTSGYLAVDAFQKGNYGSATNNAVGAGTGVAMLAGSGTGVALGSSFMVGYGIGRGLDAATGGAITDTVAAGMMAVFGPAF